MAKPNTFQICWTIHFEETLNTEKPFTQKTFSRNNLWVERKTPSLALGKVTPFFSSKGTVCVYKVSEFVICICDKRIYGGFCCCLGSSDYVSVLSWKTLTKIPFLCHKQLFIGTTGAFVVVIVYGVWPIQPTHPKKQIFGCPNLLIGGKSPAAIRHACWDIIPNFCADRVGRLSHFNHICHIR